MQCGMQGWTLEQTEEELRWRKSWRISRLAPGTEKKGVIGETVEI